MAWRIWLVDEDEGIQIVSSEDTPPDQVPIFGIMVVVQTDPNHRWTTESNKHFYVWDTRGGVTRWWGLETPDALWDYLHTPGWKRVLCGRMTSEEQFSDIFKQASEDMKMLKESYAPWERKPLAS